MRRSHSYCPQCGGSISLVKFEQKHILRCEACGSEYYFDPKVSAVCAVICKNKILLIKRGNEPGYGKWSLPGGYVDRLEIVEDAVAREVYEETGLKIGRVRLIGVYSTTESPVIVIAYSTEVVRGDIFINHEVLACQYFDLDNLPELAFPRDEDIIREAIG